MHYVVWPLSIPWPHFTHYFKMVSNKLNIRYHSYHNTANMASNTFTYRGKLRWFVKYKSVLVQVIPCRHIVDTPQIAKFMGPTWGPPGSCRPQMGPMLAIWILLSGTITWTNDNLLSLFMYASPVFDEVNDTIQTKKHILYYICSYPYKWTDLWGPFAT